MDDEIVTKDWPQQLVMSLGRLCLLTGLGIDTAVWAKSMQRDRRAPAPAAPTDALREQAARHPGALPLIVGVGLLLTGYFAPRARAR